MSTFNLSSRTKTVLRVILILAIVAIPSQLTIENTTAQGSNSLRFGVVNAFRAPDAAASSGAGWELITLRWDQLQPDGPTDWNAPQATDQWLSDARADGREVVAELIGTPAWATDGELGSGVPHGLSLPADDPNNVWANFVRQAVGYYGVQGIDRWVIWEAPDVPAESASSLWDGTTEEYYQLVKVAYQVIKQSNTNARVHLGGATAQNPAWFKRFLDVVIEDPTAAANDYYFDVATVHVFFSAEQVYTLAANPIYLMDTHGIPLKPVWLNHTSARPGVDPEVYPEDNKFRQHPNITLEQQAAFVIHAYALGFAAGAERIAIYQMADDLEADGEQAFGLVRSDGNPRPALKAYQLAVEHMSGFGLVRRVDEEAHPLIEYVRFTSASKVVHIAWARTPQNATLIIPTRSKQAALYDMEGNQWLVDPVGGIYRLVVGGADCNDPTTVGGCLIGGTPWILVEEGVKDPLYEAAPSVTVDPGGALPTPDPGPLLTATALAMPTLTPTATNIPTEEASQPTGESTQESAAVAAASTEDTTEETAPTEEAATPEPTPTLPPGTGVGPKGFAAVLPYLLIGLGAVAIGGGAWYFIKGPRQPAPDSSYTAETQEYDVPEIEQPDPSYTAETQEYDPPDFDQAEPSHTAETQEHEPPDFDDPDASTAETQTNLPKI